MIFLENKVNLFTAKGMVKPAQLSNQHVLKNYQNKIQIIEETNIVKTKGKQVKFDNGESMFLSNENSLISFDGILQVKNLKINDLIAFKNNMKISTTSNKEIGWEDYLPEKAIPIKIPENNSYKMAYWLGIYCARGFVNFKTDSVYVKISKNEELSDIFISLTKELFDLTPDVIQHSDNEYIIIYSVNVAKFIKKQVGTKNQFKKIPNVIQNSSLEEQSCFFIGLSFKAYQEKNKIVFSFSSIMFVNFTLSLLKNLGFVVSLSNKVNNKNFYVNIIGFSKKINYLHYNEYGIFMNKKINTQLLKRNYLVKVPNLSNKKVKHSNKARSSFKRIKKNNIKIVSCYVMDSLGIEFDDSLYYKKIIEIKEIEKDAISILCRSNGGLVVEDLIIFD